MARLSSQDKKWEAEQDARTLTNAEEIRQNPKKLKAAQKELNKQSKAIKKAIKKR